MIEDKIITTLIDRVRGLTGPGREVDALVEAMFAKALDDFPELAEGFEWQFEPNDDGSVDVRAIIAANGAHSGRYTRFKSAAYTASIDAVVSLIERELPGFLWRVGTDGPDDAPFGWVGRDDEAGHLAATPALALLLAFLTAMKEPRP